MNSSEELINVVTLVDENGHEVQFDHLMTFDHEKKRYIALMPMEEVEGIGEDEVLIMQIKKDDNGEDTYVPVENPVLLEEVFDTFLELREELDEEED